MTPEQKQFITHFIELYVRMLQHPRWYLATDIKKQLVASAVSCFMGMWDIPLNDEDGDYIAQTIHLHYAHTVVESQLQDRTRIN